MIEQYYKPKFAAEDAAEQHEDAACPVCKRLDMTMKASSIARASRGRFVLEDGIQAEYESDLSRQLSRPPRPQVLSAGVVLTAFILGWTLLGIDLAVVLALQAQEYFTVPYAALETAAYLGLIWFGLVIPGAAVARYYISMEHVNRELPYWRDDVQRWRSIHYCSRDDVVYVPGEGHAVSPEYLPVLYRRPRSGRVVALRPQEARA